MPDKKVSGRCTAGRPCGNATSQPDPLPSPVPDVAWYPSKYCEGLLFRDQPTLGEQYECGAHNATDELRLELVPGAGGSLFWPLPGQDASATSQAGEPHEARVRVLDSSGRVREHCADIVRAAVQGWVDGEEEGVKVLTPVVVSPSAAGFHLLLLPPLQPGSYDLMVRLCKSSSR